MNILNIDIEDNRRKWIYKRINRLENVVYEGCRQICRENTDSYKLCSSTETEWGDLLEESFMPGTFEIIEVDVLLIHHSPRQPFWSDYITFLKERTSNQRWLYIIHYSGGDDLSNRNDSVNEENKIKECFFRYPLGNDDEDKFFIDRFLHEVIQKSESIDCSVLRLNYVSEAHLLRYELLTPFIALHLSIEAYVDGGNADGLRIEEFKNLNSYLNNVPDVLKLLASRGPKGQSVFAEYQTVYKNYFEPFQNDRDICTLADKLIKEQLPKKSDKSLKVMKSNIETLAHNMEQAVSLIEFGDEPDWRMFV